MSFCYSLVHVWSMRPWQFTVIADTTIQMVILEYFSFFPIFPGHAVFSQFTILCTFFEKCTLLSNILAFTNLICSSESAPKPEIIQVLPTWTTLLSWVGTGHYFAHLPENHPSTWTQIPVPRHDLTPAVSPKMRMGWNRYSSGVEWRKSRLSMDRTSMTSTLWWILSNKTITGIFDCSTWN